MKTYKLTVGVTGTFLVAAEDPEHAMFTVRRAIEGGHLMLNGKPLLDARASAQVDGEVLVSPQLAPDAARPGKVVLDAADVDLGQASRATVGVSAPGGKRKVH